MGGFSVGGSGLLKQAHIRSGAEGQALAHSLKEKKKRTAFMTGTVQASFFPNVPSDSPPGFSPGRSTLTHSVFTAAKGPRLQYLHK